MWRGLRVDLVGLPVILCGGDSVTHVNYQLSAKQRKAKAVLATLEESSELPKLNMKEIKARVVSELNKNSALAVIDKLVSSRHRYACASAR